METEFNKLRNISDRDFNVNKNCLYCDKLFTNDRSVEI